MKPELKKLLILNAPYLLFVYLFDKIGQAVRLAPGADLSGKVLSLADGFSAAFATPLPSLAPMDLLIGIVGAVLIRLMVYFKGKNAKKYRKGIEYGSARWGNAEDIKPYTDPVFQNNVLLTQTERLTMNSRPKQPKYARNKNILVIGGSGSGKTRFFVKPNLMQMHSSYVVTDPKGTVLVECGKLLQRGGYRIKVLNTINFKKSMKYNPFAYLRCHGFYIAMVCLNDIAVNGNLAKIRRHVLGRDELHFLLNQHPFFLCYIEFDLYFSFASVHAIAPFRFEGLGHFPTSNFQPTHRRTGGRKYGKGYSFPMLATKVFSSLVTTTQCSICQKRAKEKRCNL